MIRLRSCILTRLLSPPSATYPISITPLRRLLSAAAADQSPAFAVDQYLVDTCGLTRPQALKASAKLAHLKSPSNPDAVLAFLAGLGLSSSDIAAIVAKDPQFLCASVERTLGPVVIGFTAHGLSLTEVARLASVGSTIFRCRSTVSNLPYHLSVFGSYENLLPLLKLNPSLLRYSLDKVKPNVAFLRQLFHGDCNFSKACLASPWILGTKPERLRAMVIRAEGLGVPRESPMFWHVLQAVKSAGEENITAKVEYLKETFRWSDAEVGIVVCRSPSVLHRTMGRLQRLSEFFISEVGLEPAYIAQHSVMLTLSLERRLRPRYYAIKFLKENGLFKPDSINYSTIYRLTEKVFVERYICPHKETAPHLAEDYVAACKGEAPTRFIFASTKSLT